MQLTDEARYRVRGYDGVAFWYDRPQTEPDEDTEWSGIENETGMALMVMVGDDRRFAIDPDDISPLDRSEYCPECGQVGCTAYGLAEE